MLQGGSGPEYACPGPGCLLSQAMAFEKDDLTPCLGQFPRGEHSDHTPAHYDAVSKHSTTVMYRRSGGSVSQPIGLSQ